MLKTFPNTFILFRTIFQRMLATRSQHLSRYITKDMQMHAFFVRAALLRSPLGT